MPQRRCRARGKGAIVRAQGCASSRRRARGKEQGQSSRHDVGETIASSANGFGYFCRNKSSPLAQEASGKRQGCQKFQSKDTGIRIVVVRRPEWCKEKGTRNHGNQNGHIFGMMYMDSPQNSAISGMPTFMKSVKR